MKPAASQFARANVSVSHRRGPRRIISACAVTAAVLGAPVATLPQTAPQTGELQTGELQTGQPQSNGFYSAEQAASGQREFNAFCSACHGLTMFRIFSGYPTLEAYFNYMSGSMPRHLPGSLDEDQYLAIAAFMLREAGFEAGAGELTLDRDVMRGIEPRNPHGD